MLTAVWAALIIATTIHRADFFTAQTLLAVAFTMSIVGVLAIGQVMSACRAASSICSSPPA